MVAGTFLRSVEDEAVSVCFLPSPEYLEAGKFKLPRAVLREKGADSYASFYQKKLQNNQGSDS